MSLEHLLESNIYVRIALGKDGTLFNVYKIRTMGHDADSKWEELISTNGADELGKPASDGRIIPSRRFLRKYGLDEIPQIYNIARREMSLVGIRPRDEKAWSLFPESHVNSALRYKPGFFGVHYARPNKDFQDLLKAESTYLDQKDQHPVLTDIKYFFLIFYNIIFKGMRSR